MNKLDQTIGKSCRLYTDGNWTDIIPIKYKQTLITGKEEECKMCTICETKYCTIHIYGEFEIVPNKSFILKSSKNTINWTIIDQVNSYNEAIKLRKKYLKHYKYVIVENIPGARNEDI